MSKIEFTAPPEPTFHFKGWLEGESGSGKSTAAYYIMRGLVGPQGRIAVVSTEHDGMGFLPERDWQQLDMYPPFTAERLKEITLAVQAQKFDGLIVDSASDLYEGEGGMMDQVDAANAASKSGRGAGYGAWNRPKAAMKELMQAVLACNVHIIWTVRVSPGIKEFEVDGKPKVMQVRTRAMDKKRVFDAHCVMRLNPMPEPGHPGPAAWTWSFIKDRIGIHRLPFQPKYLMGPEGIRFGEQIAEHLRTRPAMAMTAHPDIEITVLEMHPNTARTHTWLMGEKDAALIQDAAGIMLHDTVKLSGVSPRKDYAYKGRGHKAFDAQGWEPVIQQPREAKAFQHPDMAEDTPGGQGNLI